MRSWKIGLFSVLLSTDVLLKQTIEEKMNPGEKRKLLGGKVIIRKVYNRGFIFSSMEDKPELVKGVSLIAGGAVVLSDLWLYIMGGRFLEKLGMVFINAGAASNLFDRFVRGKVIDYIGVETSHQQLARITANLGDAYIALGAILTGIGNIK